MGHNIMHDSIIFDLGGVIEKISPQSVIQSFNNLGMQNPEQFFSLFRQSSTCSLFEAGKITKSDFVKHLKSICGPDVEESDIVSAWCANQIGMSQETLKTLEQLKKNGIKTYLLSNTNPIHASKVEETFFEAHKRDFRSLFNNIYYSFETHFRKPKYEAYQHVIQDSGLSADKCIFIDDLKANLIPAKHIGMHCIHHQTNTEINTISIITELLNSKK